MKEIARHPLEPLFQKWHIVLGSHSPRRVELLREMGVPFKTRPSHADECLPEGTAVREVSLTLARQKRDDLIPTLSEKELLITADTVVLQGEKLLGKPHSIEDAHRYLSLLSGKWHQVLTSYTLSTLKEPTIVEETVESHILFSELTPVEIEYYTHHFAVLDKAGAYGIQDWIGLVGVEAIRGSYTNVVGLPTQALYKSLRAITP